MPLKNLKIKKFLFLAVVIAVLFLAPTHFAKAWLEGKITDAMLALFNMIFGIIGNITVILVKLLDWVIKVPVCNGSTCNAVVYRSWQIMRDFANMFFIIALIVMAFATIFDIAKYSVKTLIAKFLIAALLINFSLTLGVLVIDGTQTLSNTFLTAIGYSADRIGQGVNPAQLTPSSDEKKSSSSSPSLSVSCTIGIFLLGPSGCVMGAIGAIISGGEVDYTMLTKVVVQIVLSSILLISVLGATLFSLVRIPMVWFLLVISPIAWIASVFPPMQEYYKSWWKQYIGWNLFLPVFLFFLYFGIYFTTNLKQITDAISVSVSQGQTTAASAFFQNVFAYVLAGIFLIGGIMMSFKVSFLSGTSAVKAASWAKGTAMNTMGFTSMGKAARMKYDQVKKEGLPGRFGQKLYGGEAGQERRTAVWAERFGVRGVDLQRQKDFVSRADKEYENIQQQYNTGKIDATGITSRAKQFSANDPQGYAYRKMLAKMGRLDDDNFAKTLTGLKNNPYAAQDFINTAKASGFANVKAPTLIRAAAGEHEFAGLGPNLIGTQREIYKHIQSNSKILSGSDFSYEHFVKGITLLGGDSSTEGSAFMKEAGNMRPDLLVKYKMDAQRVEKTKESYKKAYKDIKDEEIPSKIFEESLTDVKDIANMPLDVWRNEDFQAAVKRRLAAGSFKARQSFANNLENALRVVRDGTDKIDILKKYAPKENRETEDRTQTSGGIILPPGAQFEAANPEKVNIVDLRNK